MKLQYWCICTDKEGGIESVRTFCGQGGGSHFLAI